MAVFGVCAAMFVTSCSNDVVSNDVDNMVPETKALPGAFQVKTLTVTKGVNTEQYTFTYNASKQLTKLAYEQSSPTAVITSKTLDFDWSQAGVVKAQGYDPAQGDDMTYTYTLNDDGHVTEAVAAYSDGYVLTELAFVYHATNGRLLTIQMDGDDVVDFTYNLKGNYSKIAMEGAEIPCELNTAWGNLASFDLNLFGIFGVGSSFEEVFNYALFADLFPNTLNLVKKMQLDANNWITLEYTQGSDMKTTACTVTTTAREDDGEGGFLESSDAISYTLGY